MSENLDLQSEAQSAPPFSLPNVTPPSHQDTVRRTLVVTSTVITGLLFLLIAIGLCAGKSEEVKTFASLTLAPWFPIYSSMLTYYFVKSD